MVDILFYIFALLVLAGGVGAISFKQPVHCALCLVVALFALSVLYLLMNAEFLFAVQIFIYAGGIMVLYLFVIFLVEPARSQNVQAEPRLHRLLGFPLVLIFSPVLIFLLTGMPIAPERKVELPKAGAPITEEQVAALGPRNASDPAVRKIVIEAKNPKFTDLGNTKVLGMHLFTRYLFAFEVISIVLLVAMLGAIILGRKRFTSYTEEEEARMLAEAHYQGRGLAPRSAGAAAILAELKEDDRQQPKLPGSDFEVAPNYED